MTEPEHWPAMPVTGWQSTRDTLHLYTQVVGKICLAHEPLVNHWWNTALQVTARGLSTGLIPHPNGPAFQIGFDFRTHQLDVTTTAGGAGSVPLSDQTVASFHAEVMDTLNRLDVDTTIWPVPVEIPEAIPFEGDQTHTGYDGDDAARFWRALVDMHPVFEVFRARFVGKASPVHVFWGALDLAYTRFSGRPAPPHPGGAPNCGPHVMWEAYSHEVSSAGYWPGPPGTEGVFYAYAYPDPPGYRDTTIEPADARWDDDLDEFVLTYETVRTAANPDAHLLRFLQSTYEAAANAADWDRGGLERDDHRIHDHHG